MTGVNSGKSRGAPGTAPSAQCIQFPAVFCKNISKIIGLLTHLWGWHPPLGNPRSATSKFVSKLIYLETISNLIPLESAQNGQLCALRENSNIDL